MKIAILTPTFSAFSGIDRVAEMQAEEFAKKGNSVTIMTFKAGMNPKKDIGLIEIGMPKNPFIERIYRLFFFLDFIKIREYGDMLKGYDKAISHFYPMNVIAAYAKKRHGVEYVYHNHGIAFPYLFRNFGERVYMKLFRFFTNYTAKKADRAVSISNFLRKELKKETGMDSSLIYDKIDSKRFHKGISGKIVRQRYGLSDSPVFLYVGRISPHKGLHLLIRAFNNVLGKIPNARLLIVGKETFDDYSKELKELAGNVDRNKIVFTGFVEDSELPKYYAACDVYATATLWEGYDLPIAEAQACGRKVVAFDCCSHPEVVKRGILVKNGDVHGFAEAMVRALGKRANDFFRNGRTLS